MTLIGSPGFPLGPAASRPHVPFHPFGVFVVRDVLMYTTAICPYCIAAKNFLKARGASYTEVRVDTDPVRREEMLARSRRSSVPQMFVGDTHIGGYDDLVALDRAGGLKPLLESVA
jgi:glutaredoxin 3